MADAKLNIIINGVDKASGALGSISKALGGMAQVAGGILAADMFKKIAGGVVDFVKSGVDMNSMLEKTTLQFTTLMGDSAAATKHVKDLFAFAAKTPFETEPILKASKALLTFGGAALDTNENLTMVGDAAAAAGQNIDEVAFWVGRAYNSIQNGQPFGEAAMRLQEMGILSGDTRLEMEKLQKSGKKGPEVWNAFTKSMGKFSGAMETQAGTWEGLSSTISDNVKMISATAFRPFFDLVKTGMGALATFVQSSTFSTWASNVASALTPVASAMGAMIPKVGALIGMFLSGGSLTAGGLITYLFGANAAAQMNSIITLFSPLIGAFQNLFGVIAASGPMVAAALQTMWNFIVTKFAEVGPTLITNLSGILNSLALLWQTHGATIMAILTILFGLIVTTITGALTLISGLVNAFLLLLNGDTTGALTVLQTTWTTFMNSILSLVGTNLAEFTAVWQNNFAMIVQIVTTAVGNVISAVANGAAGLYNAGASLIQGLKEGIQDKLNDVLDTVIDLANRIKDAITDALGIASPSKVFMGYGKNMMLGMAQGIRGTAAVPATAAVNAARGVGQTTNNYFTLNASYQQSPTSAAADFRLLEMMHR